MLRQRDWRPAAAYLYLLHLDGPALAWEYLRRNADYQRDWQALGRKPMRAHPWGLCAFEDPRLDSRTAEPIWGSDPGNLTRLTADRDATTGAFDLWALPGHKHLVHDGRRLQLTQRIGHQLLRIALDDSVQHGQPVAYLLRPDATAPAQWRAIEAQRRALAAAPTEPVPAIPRPARATLLHMHALQAFDGAWAGASQRAIAATLFGADVVAARWDNDGELRSQLRYLLHRARQQVRGGYRGLLAPGGSSAQGENAPLANSP